MSFALLFFLFVFSVALVLVAFDKDAQLNLFAFMASKCCYAAPTMKMEMLSFIARNKMFLIEMVCSENAIVCNSRRCIFELMMASALEIGQIKLN